ncbi:MULTISPECIES: mechanosensitive ion channel family protein [unclassified Arsukibacterium]|uniref:mechanosensitive ion channel family protein n=1 Tax=unclassified Arsukibacterium TaxID=2635278 RepID=UPI000C950575|nr:MULTISPECIES: mechanosensitive ion channel domain-containing protein [unclassified Arsukibacterium]MAA95216.1 mechanosensitive ion channel protein MscS [Rheinheimera sp.]HAW92612.1 mechanosensitive ion channel protein MscS [Candidatus Azambacteria bacterium]|tara:strand:- start:32386 stop:33696 length:1311 start_codon:yes stop_codon:yes gene_type:complete
MEKFNEIGRSLLTSVQQFEFWWQLLALASALLLASLANQRLQALLEKQHTLDTGLRHLAVRSLQRLLWPLTALAVLVPAKIIFEMNALPVQILEVAVPVLLALAVIRLVVYILRKAFNVSPLLKSSESLLTWIIWFGVVLHLAGWLPGLLKVLEGLAMTVGETRISVLAVLKLILMVALAFTLAIWLAEFITQRVQRSTHISPSMQVGFAKFSKFLLITIAFLVALNAVGINLSSLAVFGGALGVGLGFGLQRIASNFISGFILVFDRSIKPGDIITVGDKFGWVEQLNARYVVVRNREGVDTLIPNENLITSEVINWSYADTNVRLSIKVQISYDDDPEQALALMLECAKVSPRILNTPTPTVRLMEFADSGIALELRVWITDMEKGTAEVRSDINLAIWRAFKQNKITIPYPQRDLHIKSGWPLPPTVQAEGTE